MSEKNDFIQLPPIKKDTPSEVVSMIWQYLKLPEESRKRVKAELINVHENCLLLRGYGEIPIKINPIG